MSTDTTECKCCGSIKINYQPIPTDTIEHIKKNICPKCKSMNAQFGVVPIDAPSQEMSFIFCNQCGFKYGKVVLDDYFYEVVAEILRKSGVKSELEARMMRELSCLFYRELHSPECSDIEIYQEDLDYIWKTITENWDVPPHPEAANINCAYKFDEHLLSEGPKNGRWNDCEGNLNKYYRWPLKILTAAGWIKEGDFYDYWRLR